MAIPPIDTFAEPRARISLGSPATFGRNVAAELPRNVPAMGDKERFVVRSLIALALLALMATSGILIWDHRTEINSSFRSPYVPFGLRLSADPEFTMVFWDTSATQIESASSAVVEVLDPLPKTFPITREQLLIGNLRLPRQGELNTTDLQVRITLQRNDGTSTVEVASLIQPPAKKLNTARSTR
jgi:hypothetical protein